MYTCSKKGCTNTTPKRGYCKPCRSQYNRSYSKDNRAHLTAYRREYYKYNKYRAIVKRDTEKRELLLLFAKWINENGNHMAPGKQVKYFLEDAIKNKDF